MEAPRKRKTSLWDDLLDNNDSNGMDYWRKVPRRVAQSKSMSMGRFPANQSQWNYPSPDRDSSGQSHDDLWYPGWRILELCNFIGIITVMVHHILLPIFQDITSLKYQIAFYRLISMELFPSSSLSISVPSSITGSVSILKTVPN